MNDIEKLLHCRHAVNEYRASVEFKGRTSEADVRTMKSALAEVDFNEIDDFFDFNLGMNLKEADRCIRFRRNDDTTKAAVCDSCDGRSAVVCVESCVGGHTVGRPWITAYDVHTPEMLMATDQIVEATRLNVTPGFIMTPISYFLQHGVGDTIPDYCLGRMIQIAEPQFDMYWEMDRIIEYGKTIYQNILAANGRV